MAGARWAAVGQEGAGVVEQSHLAVTWQEQLAIPMHLGIERFQLTRAGATFVAPTRIGSATLDLRRCILKELEYKNGRLQR